MNNFFWFLSFAKNCQGVNLWPGPRRPVTIRVEIGGGCLETAVGPVESWDAADVEQWLRSRGYDGAVVEGFCAPGVTGATLFHIEQGTVVMWAKKLPTALQLMADIGALTATGGAATARDEWFCPITYDLTTDPVVAEDGITYERTAIEK